MTAVLGCNSQASMEEICISLITHSVMIQAHSGIDSSRLVMAPASLIQSKTLVAQVGTLQKTMVPVRTTRGVARTLLDWRGSGWELRGVSVRRGREVIRAWKA